MSYDYELLLSLLPRHKIYWPKTTPKVALPQWRWPPLKPYNGFTSDERIMNWQLGRMLLDAGMIRKPKTCDICGEVKPLGFHSENYHCIRMDPFLCKDCHRILHQRFRYPDKWLELVDRHQQMVPTWYAIISVVPIDMAGYLKMISKRGYSNQKSVQQ
ncbi:hypothetical protein [Emcibacter sp.]|uniref:hypothetical protein n=1 Tax=Emcibacter sp. TaxID=1979954 RepID=UPI003A8D5C47